MMWARGGCVYMVLEESLSCIVMDKSLTKTFHFWQRHWRFWHRHMKAPQCLVLMGSIHVSSLILATISLTLICTLCHPSWASHRMAKYDCYRVLPSDFQPILNDELGAGSEQWASRMHRNSRINSKNWPFNFTMPMVLSCTHRDPCN